jgi:hypothetical protein
MGLIDDIRKKRDSWMARFEEHRQDEEEEDHPATDTQIEEEILRNRRMVGVFPRKGEIEG